MPSRPIRAAGIALSGVLVAFAWLWVGPSSYQPCRPAPFWDDLAAWISGSMGAGETDGPEGAPALCQIPTDLTWLAALGIVLVTASAPVYVLARGNADPSPHVGVP